MQNRLAGTYLGLISGTSMDGVDFALVDLAPDGLQTRSCGTRPYSLELRARLLEAIRPASTLSIEDVARLDIELGHCFADVALAVLEEQRLQAGDVTAIGSHGQTLRHEPSPPFPHSWQIANGASIAARTGIPTVADFRSLDVACGGEGAPLVPPFHAWAFASDVETRFVVNIGGISNVSVVKATTGRALAGYDTGPGNCLMDEWCEQHLGEPFDRDGAWAASGNVNRELLGRLGDEQYFRHEPPKSTGRELFNLRWLEARLAPFDLPTEDVQATLAQLTIETIATAIENEIKQVRGPSSVFVCGGGARNTYLMSGLATRLADVRVATTDELGIAAEFVEATAFAWFAARRVAGKATVLTTGADGSPRLHGVIHDPRSPT